MNHRIKRDPNEFFTFYRDDEVITETQDNEMSRPD